MRSQSASVVAIGFSHSTCLPASSAATAICAWLAFAEQTLTELHGPDGQPAESVAQGELCAIRTPGVVRRGDQLYKFVPAETT